MHTWVVLHAIAKQKQHPALHIKTYVRNDQCNHSSLLASMHGTWPNDQGDHTPDEQCVMQKVVLGMTHQVAQLDSFGVGCHYTPAS